MKQREDDLLLERLKREIETDLQPVQPLAQSWRRALSLLPVWVSLVVVSVGIFGIRADYQALGPQTAWILALTQVAAAYVLVAMGLQVTIPASSVAVGTLRLLVLLALLTHLAIAAFTFHRSPLPVSPDRTWELWLICFSMTFLMSLLPLAIAGTAASKGLPLSPALTGTLFGIGAGLAGEAAWRMHCHFTAWGHILTAHTSAVLAAAIMGGILGFWWRRRQSVKNLPPGSFTQSKLRG